MADHIHLAENSSESPCSWAYSYIILKWKLYLAYGLSYFEKYTSLQIDIWFKVP